MSKAVPIDLTLLVYFDRNLQIFKQKNVGAKKGYDLLKKKADALMKAYNEVLKAIFVAKKGMGKDFTQCQVAMAEATFAAGDFGTIVRDQVKPQTNVRVRITTENTAGVMKPTFNLKTNDELQMEDELIGITGGGQAINKARTAFTKYLKMLCVIASLQQQFTSVERVLKITKRRVNALEFVVIPRIQGTIKNIEDELDELDREDFFRLKVVQDKKKEAKDLEEAEMAARNAKLVDDGDKVEDDEDADIFGVDQVVEDDDDDVIF